MFLNSLLFDNISEILKFILIIINSLIAHVSIISEPNPLRPLRDLQYGLGEMAFGGCRHLEYVNIWCFNEPK